jgi:hypothetical protein
VREGYRRQRGFNVSVVALLVSLEACGGSKPDPVGPSPTLTSVVIQGLPAGFVQIGQSVQARAVGAYSDGSTRDVQASWTSSNTSVLTASPSGLVLAVGAGAADVVATVSDVVGRHGVSVAASGGSDDRFRLRGFPAPVAGRGNTTSRVLLSRQPSAVGR